MSRSREELTGHAFEIGVPGHMVEGLVAYVLDHRPPGHFLTAVLENNLSEAVARADEKNQNALVAYVRFLYNYCPGLCWGSKKKVADWLSRKEGEDNG